MATSTIHIGALIKTPKGVFGVIRKFNHEDELYTIAWANGMRQGESVIYDKKTVVYLLNEGNWKYFSPRNSVC